MANPLYPALFNNVVALATLQTANGTYRNGVTQDNKLLTPGGFAVQFDCTIVTGSVTATVVLQGSNDNSTWVDTDCTATLSATGSKIVTAPILPFLWVRARCVLAGAVTAPGDTTTVTYNLLKLY